MPLAVRCLSGLGLGNLIKKQPFFFIIFLFAFSKCAYAEDFQILQRGSISVFFEAPLESAAKQVSDLYPNVKENLGSIFGWELYLSPSILLIKDRKNFLRMAGDPLVVAFAVPQRNLIVIDYSKMITHPFSLETTLKHELCHMLLHEHIKTEILPRWLDEGLCQWASGGIGEIIMDQKRSRLNRAAFSRKFIRLQDLQQIFPPDENSRLLAYEQSKSFVSYIVRQSYENSHARFQETGKAKDPYTVLNVDRDASPEEIKNSYKKLANKYHPDKVLHLGEEFKKMAEERFKEIQETYRELIPK